MKRDKRSAAPQGMVQSERSQERETTKTRNRLHPPKTRISQTPNRGAEEKQAC